MIGIGLFFAYLSVAFTVQRYYSYFGITGEDILVPIIGLPVSIFFIWLGVASFKRGNRDSEDE